MGATLGMVGQYGGELSYKRPFPHQCGVVCCTVLMCGVCLCVLMCASIWASMYSNMYMSLLRTPLGPRWL